MSDELLLITRHAEEVGHLLHLLQGFACSGGGGGDGDGSGGRSGGGGGGGEGRGRLSITLSVVLA